MSGVELIAVTAEEGETRVDRWFKRRYPQLSHGRLEKLLRTGQVRIDGKRVASGDRIAPGQVVRVPPLGDLDRLPPPKVDERDAAALKARILYQDEDVLVIDKPAGLAVQGGSGTPYHLDGMLDALRFQAQERPKLVHRLDRDTSGALVLARNGASASALAQAFQSKEAEKVYWAVTAGAPARYQGVIDVPLVKQGGRGRERVAAGSDDGLRAITRFKVIDVATRRAAWVELRPETGRTHQLRVHCLEMGAPILGDGKYGGAAAFLPGCGLPRQVHLHARRLRIPHPRSRASDIAVTAPLPPHMAQTFEYFGFLERDGEA